MNRYEVEMRSTEKKTVEADLFTAGDDWLMFYAGQGATQALAKALVAAFPTGEVLGVVKRDAQQP